MTLQNNLRTVKKLFSPSLSPTKDRELKYIDKTRGHISFGFDSSKKDTTRINTTTFLKDVFQLAYAINSLIESIS